MVDSARALVPPDAGPVRRWFTLLVVALTAAISMSEINRLIATAVIDSSQFPADAGKRAGIDSVLAPSAFTHRDAWDVWSHTAYSDAIAVWIVCHVLLDVVLVVCMFLWLRRVFDTGAPERRALHWVVGIEFVEAITFLIGAALLAADRIGPLPVIAAIVTTAKWVAYLLLVIHASRNGDLRSRVLRSAKRVWRGLWVQRLAAIVVAGVAVLALVPKENIFDQGPDVVRSWFDADGSRRWDAFWALVTSTSIAALLLVQGRQRTERAYARDANSLQPPDPRPAQLGWWLVAPVVVSLCALVTWSEGIATIRLRPLVVSLAIPVVLVVVSYAIRRWRAHGEPSPRKFRRRGVRVARSVPRPGSPVTFSPSRHWSCWHLPWFVGWLRQWRWGSAVFANSLSVSSLRSHSVPLRRWRFRHGRRAD